MRYFHQKKFIFISIITIIAMISFPLFIWLTTFDGVEIIRYRCYKTEWCYPLSQVLEDKKLYRLPGLTSLFDSFFLFIPIPQSSLPIYHLSIDQKDHETIVEKLPTPYSIQFRDTPNLKIPGVLTVNGVNYNVEVGFRGIGFGHWSEEKKSLRISLTNRNSLNGLSGFDMAIPSDSNYYGFFMHKWGTDRLGLATNAPSLVHLFLNNRDYGPFVLFDQWNQEFLERRGLQNGLIFGDNDPSADRPPLYQDIRAWNIYKPPSGMPSDFSSIQFMLDALNNPDPVASVAKLKQIIDIENFVRWEALEIFFDTRHQDDLHNIRLYLNPVIGKLQFMPVDFVPDVDGINAIRSSFLLTIDYNPLVTRLLEDPEIRKARDAVLLDLVSDEDFQNSLWEQYDNLYRQTRGDFYRDPIAMESNLRYEWIVSRLKSQIQHNIKNLRNLLSHETQ